MTRTDSPMTLQATLEKQGSLKNCSGCGRRFGCGMNDDSCWCSESPTLAAEMITFGQDCMCPQCLDQRIDSQPNNSA